MGINSTQVYPEYWSDPNIMICPSDARAPMPGAGSLTLMGSGDTTFRTPFPGIDLDVAAHVAAIDDSVNPQVAHVVRHAILSFPISYLYNPWATDTSGKLMYAFHSVANPFAWMPISVVDGTTDADAIAAVGGPSSWDQIAYWERLGEEDIPDFRGLPWWETDGFVDDNGALFDGTAYRTREGIERFLITDINNPAASAHDDRHVGLLWAKRQLLCFGRGGGSDRRFQSHPRGNQCALHGRARRVYEI